MEPVTNLMRSHSTNTCYEPFLHVYCKSNGFHMLHNCCYSSKKRKTRYLAFFFLFPFIYKVISLMFSGYPCMSRHLVFILFVFKEKVKLLDTFKRLGENVPFGRVQCCIPLCRGGGTTIWSSRLLTTKSITAQQSPITCFNECTSYSDVLRKAWLFLHPI